MRRIAKPLAAMGASVELPAHGGLPMTVRGAALRDVEWVNETGSAQVKSCILFAALCGGVEAKVIESPRSRDHTERMLASQGVDVWVNDESVLLHPASRLSPLDVTVPGDPSSAAFFAALAALAPDGELLLRRVCVNETRTGFLAALKEMGANIELLDQERLAGEWVADVAVKAGATLRGISIGRDAIPTLIDELPLVACLAAYAEGETRVTGAEELRVKESDRIAVVVGNLRSLGADVDELPDGFVVRGSAPTLHGRVVTHADHRMAMAFGVLGALPGNEIEIDDRDCVAVSYPTFWEDLSAVTTS
jgi:3-phosphoshikimate 1-carboxyvinyltransferase